MREKRKEKRIIIGPYRQLFFMRNPPNSSIVFPEKFSNFRDCSFQMCCALRGGVDSETVQNGMCLFHVSINKCPAGKHQIKLPRRLSDHSSS